MAQNGPVDISGLDKEQLLVALWRRSRPAAFFANACMCAPAELSVEGARAGLRQRGGCIDYIEGRVIQCDFSGDLVDPHHYDRDIGEGAFADVVNVMRDCAMEECV